jgi:hypothetical protein
VRRRTPGPRYVQITRYTWLSRWAWLGYLVPWWNDRLPFTNHSMAGLSGYYCRSNVRTRGLLSCTTSHCSDIYGRSLRGHLLASLTCAAVRQAVIWASFPVFASHSTGPEGRCRPPPEFSLPDSRRTLIVWEVSLHMQAATSMDDPPLQNHWNHTNFT